MKARNQYRIWTMEDDDMLIDWYYAGLSRALICFYLGRTPNGIGARLRRLGIIETRKEFTQYHR